MRYSIKETDEALEDLGLVSIQRFRYFGSLVSGDTFLSKYDKAVETLHLYPEGFVGREIFYRGYEIRLLPFDDYYIFFVFREIEQDIVILRVLHKTQNWQKIMINKTYHIKDLAI